MKLMTSWSLVTCTTSGNWTHSSRASRNRSTDLRMLPASTVMSTWLRSIAPASSTLASAR